MAKKSKKSAPTPPRPKSPPTQFGTLGDLLGRPATPRPTPMPEEPKRPTPVPVAPATRPVVREVTEDDLMREAFEAAKADHVYGGKYDGIGFDPGNVIIVRAEAPAAEAASPTRSLPEGRAEVTPEDLMFFDAMSGVQAVAKPNRLSDRLQSHDWTGARWADRVELTNLSAAELHEPTLSHEQRQLLRRSRNETMAVLNIRHLRRDQALREVESFVRTCARRSLRYVRIITGKGRQSPGGTPVLKPAVIAWCQDAGVRWVRSFSPETDRSGDYGSVVLELREAAL